jgi:hypothetical protein
MAEVREPARSGPMIPAKSQDMDQFARSQNGKRVRLAQDAEQTAWAT